MEAPLDRYKLAQDGRTEAPLVLLTREAPPLARLIEAELSPPPADIVFVLGDDLGLSEEELKMITEVGEAAGGGGRVLRASVGSADLLASHVIVITHYLLDQVAGTLAYTSI